MKVHCQGNLQIFVPRFTRIKLTFSCSLAQAKESTNHRKCYETVQFQSSYTDFVNKFLESFSPDRFVDFKNIECLIQELNNLYKEISKEDKIGPFNPNLPILNISECRPIVKIISGSKDLVKMKSATNTKHIRNKKRKSHSHLALKTLKTQKEAQGKEKRSKAETKKLRSVEPMIPPKPMSRNKSPHDADDENGKNIARNIEDLLSEDTFTPRYNAKRTSEVFMIFQKSFNENDLITSGNDEIKLEKEAIEQYQHTNDNVDMNFNLLEMQARQQYEP